MYNVHWVLYHTLYNVNYTLYDEVPYKYSEDVKVADSEDARVGLVSAIREHLGENKSTIYYVAL